MTTPSRFLDPSVVARLGTIDIKARTIVEGFLSGLHRSPFRGYSVEFAEYRPYLKGDDLATLDWKVFARTDRHVVRKFEHDTNLECHIVLDISRSMSFASGAVSKLEYGSYVAATLAYLMHRQHDAVGLVTVDDRIRFRMPPGVRSGHLRALLVALERLTPGEATRLATPFGDLVEAIDRRGLVVVISDLLDDANAVIDGLSHFRHKGTDVVVFQVLDPYEREFPFERASRFRDMESGAEVALVPGEMRERYVTRMREQIAHYRHALGQHGIDYCLLTTTDPLDTALLAYLQTRRKIR